MMNPTISYDSLHVDFVSFCCIIGKRDGYYLHHSCYCRYSAVNDAA